MGAALLLLPHRLPLLVGIDMCAPLCQSFPAAACSVTEALESLKLATLRAAATQIQQRQAAGHRWSRRTLGCDKLLV